MTARRKSDDRRRRGIFGAKVLFFWKRCRKGAPFPVFLLDGNALWRKIRLDYPPQKNTARHQKIQSRAGEEQIGEARFIPRLLFRAKKKIPTLKKKVSRFCFFSPAARPTLPPEDAEAAPPPPGGPGGRGGLLLLRQLLQPPRRPRVAPLGQGRRGGPPLARPHLAAARAQPAHHAAAVSVHGRSTKVVWENSKR